MKGFHVCKPGNAPTVGQVKSLLVSGDRIKSKPLDQGGANYTITAVTPRDSYKDSYGNVGYDIEIAPVEGQQSTQVDRGNGGASSSAEYWSRKEERDIEAQKRMSRAHAQDMAIQYWTLLASGGGITPEDVKDAKKLRAMIDFFQKGFVAHSVSDYHISTRTRTGKRGRILSNPATSEYKVIGCNDPADKHLVGKTLHSDIQDKWTPTRTGRHFRQIPEWNIDGVTIIADEDEIKQLSKSILAALDAEREKDVDRISSVPTPLSTTVEIIERLRYIADSPPSEHGGFHPNAIQTAKDAIAALAAEYAKGREHTDIAIAQPLREQLAVERTMNGEWTHEKLQGLLQISNEDRYVADHAFENTLDEINSALAAEREKFQKAKEWNQVAELELRNSRSLYNELIDDFTKLSNDHQQLREQLAAERENVEIAHRGMDHYHDQAEKLREQLAAAQAAIKTIAEASFQEDEDYRAFVGGYASGALIKGTSVLDAAIAEALSSETASLLQTKAVNGAIAAAQQPLVDALEQALSDIETSNDPLSTCSKIRTALAKVKEGKS